MHPHSWPHHRVDRLTALWSSSLPAPEIAARLTYEFPAARPVSGDAVTKKARMEGLPERARTVSKEVPKRAIMHRGGGFAALVSGNPREPTIFKEDDLPAETRKTLLELKNGDCRWPGGGFFCGLPTEPDRSWCLDHCFRAFVGYQRRFDDKAA